MASHKRALRIYILCFISICWITVGILVRWHYFGVERYRNSFSQYYDSIPIRASKSNRRVVTVVSPAMAEFAENWWHSLRDISEEAGLDVQVISLAEGLCESMAGNLPCEYGSLSPMAVRPRIKFARLLEARENFYEMVAKKLLIFAKVLHKADDGDWVLLADVDVVFFSNPFAFLDTETSEDIEVWGSAEDHLCPPQHNIVNSGLLFFKASRRTRELLDNAIELLITESTKDGGEQSAINAAMAASNVRFKLLPCDRYANGLVFFYRKQAPNPVALHATYTAGRLDLKKECLKAAGLWFGDGSWKQRHWEAIAINFDRPFPKITSCRSLP